MRKTIQAVSAKFAKQGSEARTYQTLARDPRATSDLLALWNSRPLKAILESAGNRKAARAHQARSASADEACSILQARVRLQFEQSGANWKACLVCPVFARLTFEDVLGCPNAEQGFCLGTAHKVPCAEASGSSVTRLPVISEGLLSSSPDSAKSGDAPATLKPKV